MRNHDNSENAAGLLAYKIIRSAVICGAFPPGMRLKEVELAGLCHTSRTPVREALNRLSVEGLVVCKTNHGAQVAPIDLMGLAESYALLIMIESRVGAIAAIRITWEEIERLKLIVAEMELLIDRCRYLDEANARLAHTASELDSLVLESTHSDFIKLIRLVAIDGRMPHRALITKLASDRNSVYRVITNLSPLSRPVTAHGRVVLE